MNGIHSRTPGSDTGKFPFPRLCRRAWPIPFAVVIVTLLQLLPATTALAAPLEIATDTLWEGSVEVNDEVRILKGATLLIQPGATVRFAGEPGGSGQPRARLVVNGVLVAQGTAAAPIVFTSAGKDPHAGDWAGIVLEHSREKTSRISHARIEYAATGITGSYAALRVENAIIRNNLTGILALQELSGSIFDSTISGNTLGISFYQSSAFQIENCTISGNRNGGIGCISGSSPPIGRSTIADNGERGVVCIQGSSPLLEGNTIRGQQRGIHVELQSKPLIIRNSITGNETGIWNEKYAFARIFENSIQRNGVGIFCNFASYPEIRGNNLDDNAKFSIVIGDNMSIKVEKLIPFRSGGKVFDATPTTPEVLPPRTRKFAPIIASEEGLVDARGNWWGVRTAAEMEQLGVDGNITVIEDFHDKPETFYLGKPYPRDRVRFSPWEREPVKETAPAPSPFAKIIGTVISSGNPVPGVRVHAYGSAAESFTGQGFTYSAPTAADGSYSLNVPQGSYFLFVKGPPPPFPYSEPGANAFFGAYGGNPVTVGAGATGTFTIEAARRTIPPAAPGGNREKSSVDGKTE